MHRSSSRIIRTAAALAAVAGLVVPATAAFAVAPADSAEAPSTLASAPVGVGLEDQMAINVTQSATTYSHVGETITFQVSVTNLGDVPITDLLISEARGLGTLFVKGIHLEKGQTYTFPQKIDRGINGNDIGPGAKIQHQFQGTGNKEQGAGKEITASSPMLYAEYVAE